MLPSDGNSRGDSELVMFKLTKFGNVRASCPHITMNYKQDICELEMSMLKGGKTGKPSSHAVDVNLSFHLGNDGYSIVTMAPCVQY